MPRPPPLRARREFASLEEIPLDAAGLWDVVEMAKRASVPTVYRGCISEEAYFWPILTLTLTPTLGCISEEELFSPLLWLGLHENLQLLLPGEQGPGHNAFSTKRSGWESGYRQESRTMPAADFDPEAIP